MSIKPKFIDLFAGIGGFRLGMTAAGFKGVFGADHNKHAALMYKENFGEEILRDITAIEAKTIPDFDVMCAGFPCQPFSLAGGQLGFLDKTRGTLFFDLCRIIQEKQPNVVFLENVKNLATHDKGNTLKVIIESLEKLGYTATYKVLNARDFGVPQSRERIIIVANRKGIKFDFDKVKQVKPKSMERFLDKDSSSFEILAPEEYTLLSLPERKLQKSGLIFAGYRNKEMRGKGVRANSENLSRAHKQPNRIYSAEGTHPTLSSQETSGRYFILHNDQVRKLTLNECYKFMGFPKNFKKIGSKSDLYNRIGNSICVPMVKAVAQQIKEQLF